MRQRAASRLQGRRVFAAEREVAALGLAVAEGLADGDVLGDLADVVGEAAPHEGAEAGGGGGDGGPRGGLARGRAAVVDHHLALVVGGGGEIPGVDHRHHEAAVVVVPPEATVGVVAVGLTEALLEAV
jgi:hypothetical protein